MNSEPVEKVLKQTNAASIIRALALQFADENTAAGQNFAKIAADAGIIQRDNEVRLKGLMAAITDVNVSLSP